MDLEDELEFSQTDPETSNFMVLDSQSDSPQERAGETYEWPALQSVNKPQMAGRKKNILSAAMLEDVTGDEATDNPEVLVTDSKLEGNNNKSKRRIRLPSDADEVISDSEGQAVIKEGNGSSDGEKTLVNQPDTSVVCSNDSSSSFHTNSRQGLGSYNVAEMSHTQDTNVRGHRFKLLAEPLSQDMFEDKEGDDAEGEISTPSDYIGTLHLSNRPMLVPETVDEDILDVPPSPDVYGSAPIIVPTSPTASITETNEEMNVTTIPLSTAAESMGFICNQDDIDKVSSGKSPDPKETVNNESCDQLSHDISEDHDEGKNKQPASGKSADQEQTGYCETLGHPIPGSSKSVDHQLPAKSDKSEEQLVLHEKSDEQLSSGKSADHDVSMNSSGKSVENDQSVNSSGKSLDVTVRRKSLPLDVTSSEDLQYNPERAATLRDHQSVGGESLHLHYTESQKGADKQDKPEMSVQLIEDDEEESDDVIVISFEEETQEVITGEHAEELSHSESQNVCLRLSPSQHRQIQDRSVQSITHQELEDQAPAGSLVHDKNKESKPQESSVGSDSAAFHLSLPKEGTLLHPVPEDTLSPSTHGAQESHQKPQGSSSLGIKLSSLPKGTDGRRDEDTPAVNRSPSLTIDMIDIQPSQSQQSFQLERPVVQDVNTEMTDDTRFNVFRRQKAGTVNRSPSRRQILHDDSDEEIGMRKKRQREELMSTHSSQQGQPQLKRARTLSSEATSTGYKASLESMDTTAPRSPIEHMEVQEEVEDVMMQETESYDPVTAHPTGKSNETGTQAGKIGIDINIHLSEAAETRQAFQTLSANKPRTPTTYVQKEFVSVGTQSSTKEGTVLSHSQEKGRGTSNILDVSRSSISKEADSVHSISPVTATRTRRGGKGFSIRKGKQKGTRIVRDYLDSLPSQPHDPETSAADPELTMTASERSPLTKISTKPTLPSSDPYQFHGSQSQTVSPLKAGTVGDEIVPVKTNPKSRVTPKLVTTPRSTHKKWRRVVHKKSGIQRVADSKGHHVSFDNPVTVSLTTPPNTNPSRETTPKMYNVTPCSIGHKALSNSAPASISGPTTGQDTRSSALIQSCTSPDRTNSVGVEPLDYKVITKTVTKIKIIESREITQSVFDRAGKCIRTSTRKEEDEPSVIKEMIQEKSELVAKSDLSPSPSRSTSTLTSGDLGDVSSSLSRYSSGSRGSRLSLNSGSLEAVMGSLPPENRSVNTTDHFFTPPESVSRPGSRRSDTHKNVDAEVQCEPASREMTSGHSVHETATKDVTPGHSDHETSLHEPDVSTINKTGSDVVGRSPVNIETRRSSESLFTSSVDDGQPGPAGGDNRAVQEGDMSSDGITCAQRKTREQVTEESDDAIMQVVREQVTESEAVANVQRKKIGGKRSSHTSSSKSDDLSPEISYQDKGGNVEPEQSETSSQKHQVLKSNGDIGDRIMARWSDGYFYPGTIMQLVKSKYQVKFDDGDMLMVKANNILFIKRLPIGLSVLVQSEGGYFDSGIITDVKAVKSGGYMYTVEKDDGKSGQFRSSQVILSEDQALTFETDQECHLSLMSPRQTTIPKVADVSLDNLIEGKRRAGSRYEQLDVSMEFEKTDDRSVHATVEDSAIGPVPSTSRGKRSRANMILEPTATSTPTPKGKQRTRTRGYEASPIGTASSSSVLVRRSPRKSKMGLFDTAARSAAPNDTFFSGMVFLLTHVEKTAEQKQSDKQLLQDSSLSTDDGAGDVADESTQGFDKVQLKRLITSGGGIVLDKYSNTEISAAHQCFLLSDSYQRTIKYFQCLASAIPCISHLWISDSCRQDKLLDYKSYMLQAGISYERKKVMEWNPRCGCLKGLSVLVVSQKSQFQEEWTNIMNIAQCKVVKKFPVHGAADAVSVVITDNTCPANILRRAKQLSVPAVSSEWAIQCLINGKRMKFDGHPRYKFDFVDR